MPASRLLIALSVILLGFCAALPFRQRVAVRPAPPRATPHVELPLRQADAPLGLPQPDPSPAKALARGVDDGPPPFRQAFPLERGAEALVGLAPPPAMPISFQPIAEEIRPTSWKPAAPSIPPLAAKPRAYRLRDGDTLERLAERYLGDKSRAEEIFAGNRHVLARPDLLPVGVEILLPPRQLGSK